MTTRAVTAELARPLTARVDPGALGTWALGFTVVTYLAMQGGGYDIVVRSQVGIALWWIVLVGAALGVLPQRRFGRPGTAAIALLACFGVWSALSAIWSESPERAMSETARIATLGGVLVLAASAVRAKHVRPLMNGVFTAIAGVAVLACVSRLHPAWFGPAVTGEFLPNARPRLAYPVNYWNALAALLAMGLPLGLAVAMTGRTLAGRTTAVALLPVFGLTGFFTLSRGGILAAIVGLLVALALTPERGRWAAKAGLAAAGAAILIKGALQRDELRNGLTSSLAHHQGDELLVVGVVVVTGVALVHVGLSLARASGLLPAPHSLPRGYGYAAWSFAAGVAAVLAVAAVASGNLHQRWENFKDPRAGLQEGRNTQFSRLTSASGNGRYQYWVSSLHAFKSAPLGGLGAGSFETWWARHATLPGTVRNAHSLYAETLGELGIPGLAFVAALFLLVIAAGVGSTRRSTGPPRAVFAGIAAALAAFAVSAGVDWVWQVTVLPACFLLLAVAVLGGGKDDVAPPTRHGLAALVVLAIVALVALVVPLASATQLRDSQQEASAMRYDPALRHAANAGRVEPYASSPALQRALVLELSGDLDGAAAAARQAERNEPTNWRPPFVLARLETERGHVTAALAAFRRARALNKESSFLQ